jgi:lipopolysaccharide export system permease protein
VRETTFISYQPLLRLWRRAAARVPVLPHLPLAAQRYMRALRIAVNAPFYVLRGVFRILPVYLIKKFLAYLTGTLIAIVVVFAVIDFISNMRSFETATVGMVARYYAYYLPWIVLTVLPIVVLLASMFAVGALTKHSELVAVKASGIGVRQLTVPVLLFGAVVSVLSFFVGELVLPDANYRRAQLKQDIRDGRIRARTGAPRRHREFRRNFFYFGNPNTIYCFEEFRTHPHRTKNVWRETFRGNRIMERVQAASLDYRDSAWYFADGSVRTFAADSCVVTTFDTLADTVLTASPDEMVVRIKGEEEMSYWELSDFIEKVKRRGEKVSMHQADLNFKIALPTMNFIVLLLGISMTARAGRKGAAVLFGIALLMTFAYWIIAQFALAFAHNGQLSPLTGAWLGNALFLLLGLALYWRANR